MISGIILNRHVLQKKKNTIKHTLKYFLFITKNNVQELK